MKEADIRFGSLYAVEIDNVKVCKKVRSKMAPEKGKQRSRTYIITNPDEDVSSYPDTIDASKIVMLWTDYERTPEYGWSHIDSMERDLNNRVMRELSSWWALVGQCVASLTGARVGNTYVPHNMQSAGTAAEVMAAMREIVVSVPIGTLIDLAEVPIPSMASVTSAIEMRADVLKGLRATMIPAAEKAFVDAFELASDGSIAVWDLNLFRSYVGLLVETDTAGPHPTLIRLAQDCPTSDNIKQITAHPLFHYLIQYLK